MSLAQRRRLRNFCLCEGDILERIVLILGGFGFIGLNIARKYKKNGFYVMGYGRGNCSDTAVFDEIIHEDIKIEILNGLKKCPSVVINCAGTSSVSKVETNRGNAFINTVESNNTILEYIRGLQNKDTLHYIYISSAAVYGNTMERGVSEIEDTNPISFYGLHKLICEETCKYYSIKYGIKMSVLRPFSVCGVGLRKQLLWDACNKFSCGKNEFWGTGYEKRDWIDVDDLTELIYQVNKRQSNNYEIYNACTGFGVCNRDFLKYMAYEFGCKFDIVFNSIMDDNNPKYLVGNNIKATSSLSWQPIINWKQSIKKYIKWYKTQG